MHAIISYHDHSYQPLADRTWIQNKIPYCERHGYHYEFEPLEGINKVGQLQKVRMINRMINTTDYEWLWWTGCDLMITNYNIRIEDRIDNNYHMVIASDCHGINADSILIRNSNESREYWKWISDTLPGYNWWEGEQGLIKESVKQGSSLIKVVPQRDINAYQYNLYPTEPNTDDLGTVGEWQEGDWAIQWPGLTLPPRIQLADYYATKVIK
jgi:hypothetical protein